MIRVQQTRFGNGNGNCLLACVASILERPLETIPDFAMSGIGRKTWRSASHTLLIAKSKGGRVTAKTKPATDYMAILKPILTDSLGVIEEEISPSADLVEDLGMDSLDIVEMCMQLEMTLGIEQIQDESMEGLKTVQDVLAFMEGAKR